MAVNKKPFLSVIIPTLNEEEYLPFLLDNLHDQTFRDFEIIVCDSNSQDNTVAIAEKWGCRIIHGKNVRNPGMARNQGAQHAKGELLLFFDADVMIPPEFIALLVEEFQKKKAVVAVPAFESISEDVRDRIISSMSNVHQWVFQFFSPICAGYCILVQHKVFKKINGFN